MVAKILVLVCSAFAYFVDFLLSIVAASKFNYLGPIMWIVLDRFNSFLTVVSTIKNYVTIVKYITHGFFLHASRESKI